MRTGNSSGNNNNVCIPKSKFRSIILGKVAGDFLYPHQPFPCLFVEEHTAGDEICERSAATPGVLTTSYSANSVMRGEVLRRRDNGCWSQQCSTASDQDNSPVQFHQKHQRQLMPSVSSIISSKYTGNKPALIPILAVSAMIEFCSSMSTFTPHYRNCLNRPGPNIPKVESSR